MNRTNYDRLNLAQGVADGAADPTAGRLSTKALLAGILNALVVIADRLDDLVTLKESES